MFRRLLITLAAVGVLLLTVGPGAADAAIVQHPALGGGVSWSNRLNGLRTLFDAGAGMPSARRPLVLQRLAIDPQLFQYDPAGAVVSIFGVPRIDARFVFYPVSQTRALPDGYTPADLVRDFGHPVRSLIAGELRAMLAAAEQDGAYPLVVSAFRSAEYQAVVFERAAVQQQRRDDQPGREDAEARAARFVARPGHSQHQLGTTVDISSYEIGYALRASFAETTAGRWLAQHAWEFGFIQPYTTAAEPRTGYVAEPWHYRWVGRRLAALLWEDGYLANGYPTADDALLALEEIISPVLP